MELGMNGIGWALGALMMGGTAWAEEPPAHQVVHYTDADRRQTPSGKAAVYRIAGKQEGAQNAFFAVLEIQPGAKVPVHRDATEEYIFIQAGSGTITIDGKVHAVQPGTGVFMPANAEVSFEATGEVPVLAVQFFAGQGPEAKYDKWVSESAK